MTILHIDDDPLVLRSIRRYLVKQGHQVVSAESGVGAEQLFEEHQPDMLILDVVMPERSGLEVFDAIKATYRTVPVLFCTGYSESFDFNSEENVLRWHKAFADGLTDLMYKPFSLEELGEKVESLNAMQGLEHG